MRIEDTHFSAYTEKTESKAQAISLFHVILMLKKEREDGKVLKYFLISVKLNTSPDKQQTEAIICLLV